MSEQREVADRVELTMKGRRLAREEAYKISTPKLRVDYAEERPNVATSSSQRHPHERANSQTCT